MVENETRGWFGSFSNAGRNSAEKYHVIMHKEEILANMNKRIKLKEMFEPDEEREDDESLEEHIDIFQYDLEKANNVEIKAIKSVEPVPIVKDRFKYHNKHVNEAKNQPKKEEPPRTKYNPKMDYVWQQTSSGPQWKTLRGRRYYQEYDDKEFYINHPDISNLKQKGFISMEKQTRRLDFPTPKDIRIRNEAKFVKGDKFKALSSRSHSSSYIKLFPQKKGTEKTPIKKQHSMQTIKQFCLGKDKQLSKKKTQEHSSLLDLHRSFVPDFKLSLSREQLDKRFNSKRDDPPLCYPNYSSITQRPVMMVTYDHASSVKNKEAIKGMDPSSTFDPSKVLDKVNNHKSVRVPIFKNMTSRPLDNKDPLPSYMKKIYTRASVYNTTDKTLMMNNFADSKYLNGYTSFFPKKSFNKIINLNLLNSDNLSSTPFELTSQFTQLGNLLSKTMRFYRKNYDEIINGRTLNQFDNVTYKGIKRQNKLNTPQMQKFMINFDKIDQSY